MSIVNPEYRAPDFQQLAAYLMATYGKRKGMIFYYEWLHHHGYNEATPMMMQKLKGCNSLIELFKRQTKSKSNDVDRMRKRIREKIIEDSMRLEGHELEDFAKKVDIEVEPIPVEQEDLIPTAKEYSITELAMSSDPISEPQRLRQLVNLSKKKRVLGKIVKEDKTPSVTELAMNADTLSNPLALKKLVEAEEDAEEEEQ